MNTSVFHETGIFSSQEAGDKEVGNVCPLNDVAVCSMHGAVFIVVAINEDGAGGDRFDFVDVKLSRLKYIPSCGE